MNRPGAALRFNRVRQQIRLQLGYIQEIVIEPSFDNGLYASDQDFPQGPHETHPNVPSLTEWWDQWSTDFFDHTSQRIRTWTQRAINRLRDAYGEVDPRRPLRYSDTALNALLEFEQRIAQIEFPPDTSMQNPQPPGGSGAGGSGSDSGSGSQRRDFFESHDSHLGLE